MAETKSLPPEKVNGEGSDENEGKDADAKSKVEEKPVAEVRPRRRSRQEHEYNCCQKFWAAVLKIFAHDAIYGSFVGPHPVSFACVCLPCRACCDRKMMIPFCVASIATKVMNFVMLGVVALLASFFIIPWPSTWLSHESTSIASFFPCQNNKLAWANDINGGCIAHAGYFMVYRCFLAYGTVMLTNNLLMVFVTSTQEDPYRTKIHHGFWLYKFAYLTGLLFLYFLILNGSHDRTGLFEYVCSIFGNFVHFVFSLIELTFIMDITELWVIENRNSGSNWKDFLYAIPTGVIFLFDFIAFTSIVWEFAFTRTFKGGDFWPANNCQMGERSGLDFVHIGLILGMVGVIVLMIFIMCGRERIQKRFPYAGWLQVAVLTGFNLFYLWSALYSSPRVNSRPRCNWALDLGNRSTPVQEKLQPGSLDIYYRHTGFIHGLLVIFALLYYAFIHGPRSRTAPFSIAFLVFWGKESKVPVFPDVDNGPGEFKEAVEKLKVWDDEKEDVSYSWSKFYLIMGMGGFSLMMAMTNFTNPWTHDKYNSSVVAMGFKYGTGVMGTLIYIMFLIFSCSKIHPGYVRRRKVKKLVVVVDGNNEETVLETEVMEDVYEEEEEVEAPAEEEVGEVRRTSSVPMPKNCGCLL